MAASARARSTEAGSAGPARPLRVAVVGARRVRQGTGPFLARHFAAEGAKLCAVLGTTAATAEEARATLAAGGLAPRAYHEWERLAETERPEVLVVASPAGTHRPWIEAGLAAGAHVLCEKPLLTGADLHGADARTEAVALAQAFAEKKLLLREACQWPFTLGAFAQLHPQFALAQAERLRMRMAPPRRGRELLEECLSHPLSLLTAAAPGPARVQPVHCEHQGSPAHHVQLRFYWITAERKLNCHLTAYDTSEFPRPADYAFDGADCNRVVKTPGYRFFFATGAGEREVEWEDPLQLLVRDFLVAAQRGECAPDPAIPDRQQAFQDLLATYAD